MNSIRVLAKSQVTGTKVALRLDASKAVRKYEGCTTAGTRR